MKIKIEVDKDELAEIIAGYLRWKALEDEGVMYWSRYYDALSDGLGRNFYSIDGDYFSPYKSVANSIIEEVLKCQ